MATHKSSRKRQTRLNFTPVASSSPQRPEANVRIDEISTPTKKRKVDFSSSPSLQLDDQSSPFSHSRVQVMIHSPAGNADQLPTPAASSQIIPKPSARNEGQDGESASADRVSAIRANESRNMVISDDEEDEEEEEIFPKSRRRPRPPISLSSGSDVSEPFAPVSHRPRKPTTLTNPQPQTPTQKQITPSKPRSAKSFLLGGSSGTVPIPHQVRRRLSSTKNDRREDSKLNATSSPDRDFEGETPVPSSRRTLRSSTKTTTRPSRQNEACMDRDSSVSKSDHLEVIKSQKGKSNQPIETQDASDSDPLITPIRQRGRPGRPKSSVQDHGPGSDLEAEIADLEDLDGRETPKTRTRGTLRGSERNKRIGKLEELKRRRAGIVELSDDESQEGLVEDDYHSVVEDEYARESDANLDEYEEDFISDNGDEAIGVDLARGGVPLEFTRYANLKPFEYFKYVVEWMVHAKLDPAFERNDEVYQLAHKKLDDEVKGHAGSTFKSSVWRQEFSDALTSRPDIFRVDIPTMLEHKCDACNRSGHPPKHRIILTGSRYDKNTLEKISTNTSDNEDDTSDNSTSSDATDDEQTFFLGRFCCANAEIAHALYHWRYQLNQTILEWLSTNGHTTPEKIVERENWGRKKRERLANKVVDGMVDGGEMKVLYMQFKQNLDAARSAKVRSVLFLIMSRGIREVLLTHE